MFRGTLAVIEAHGTLGHEYLQTVYQGAIERKSSRCLVNNYLRISAESAVQNGGSARVEHVNLATTTD